MVDSADGDADATADSEWRFTVDDVDPEVTDGSDAATTIEPEAISLEHATFVLLGVLLTVGVVVTGI